MNIVHPTNGQVMRAVMRLLGMNLPHCTSLTLSVQPEQPPIVTVTRHVDKLGEWEEIEETYDIVRRDNAALPD